DLIMHDRIKDITPLAPRVHEPCFSKDFEVRAQRRKAHSAQLDETLDRMLCVIEEAKEMEAGRMSERLRDLRKTAEERISDARIDLGRAPLEALALILLHGLILFALGRVCRRGR